MSPTQFHDHTNNNINNHAKKDHISGSSGLISPPHPPPLKINKDSHFIKKLSSSSSSSSSSPPSSSSSSTSSLVNGISGSAKPQQQRHPVIIYTHSPKVIHTHPRDFMALVQKLTGLSRSDGEIPREAKTETGNASPNGDSKSLKNVASDDNESSSVITDENCSSSSSLGGDGQVNSCFVPPIFEQPNHPYLTNIPVFTPNSKEFLCSNQPFYNYTDTTLFNFTPNRRTSVSPSSIFDGIAKFPHEF